jgi:4-amino-4-deoxy-L-arabinose transferase-like glycosyltransferase
LRNLEYFCSLHRSMSFSRTDTARRATDIPAASLPHVTTVVWLGLLCLLGFALRLTGVAGTGYWTDELFSVFWSREKLAFLWGQGMSVETNPPLYYTLLHYWMLWLGSGEAPVRLLGALASTAAVPAVFVLALEFAEAPVALGAALLMAVAPVQVAYAHEARAYALLPLLVALATLGLLRFARNGGLGALLLYAVAAVALVYTHATAVFVLTSLSACSLALLLWQGPARRLWPWLLANSAVALASIPELVAMAGQAGSHNISWIGRPTAFRLAEVLDVLLVDPATPQIHLRLATLAALLMAAAMAVALVRRPPSPPAWLMLAGPAALFLATVTLVSFRVPILVPRIAVWISAPLCVLIVLAARDRVNAALLGVPILICCAIGLTGDWQLAPRTKEDWRGLMAEVVPRIAPGDSVAVAVSSSPFAVTFYGGPRRLLRWEPAKPPPDALLFAADRQLDIHPVATADLAALARAGHLWLLLDRDDQRDYHTLLASALPPPNAVLHGPAVEAMGWQSDAGK